MTTVYKFSVDIKEFDSILIPVGAEILSVQAQHGEVVMWAKVDTDAMVASRHFGVFGTGHPLPDKPLQFIATTQMLGGALVWHVFEYVEEKKR